MPFLSALQDSVAPLFMLNTLFIFIKTWIAHQDWAVFSVVFFWAKKDHQSDKYCLYLFLKISMNGWCVKFLTIKPLGWTTYLFSSRKIYHHKKHKQTQGNSTLGNRCCKDSNRHLQNENLYVAPQRAKIQSKGP